MKVELTNQQRDSLLAMLNQLQFTGANAEQIVELKRALESGK